MVRTSTLPVKCFHEIGSGDPIEKETLVEFRLLYSGRLAGSSSTNSRGSEKQALREDFHPQLKRLWETNTSLKNMARLFCLAWRNKHPEQEEQGEWSNENTDLEEGQRKAGLLYISEQWERCGYNLVPLVTKEYCLRCSLDILFLRPEEGRNVLQGGDLDARMKTLFDALRIPQNLDEVCGKTPSEHERPFYCLLEDDSLISEVKITTDQLLLLPKEREMKANDVFMVIDVRLNPTRRTQTSWAFE